MGLARFSSLPGADARGYTLCRFAQMFQTLSISGLRLCHSVGISGFPNRVRDAASG